MLLEPVEGEDSQYYENFSGLSVFDAEPVGRAYLKYWIGCQSGGDDVTDDENEEDEDDESIGDIELDVDEAFIKSLDPKEWKKQDHYNVIGLGKHRFSATGDQIKKAYRKMVLTHHPDKRKGRGENVRDADSDYFSCITRAYEILGNVFKRRSYDSIDPEFDDFIPPVSSHSKDNFYEVFAKAFETNSRWSTHKSVPQLGGEDDSFEKVDDFYSFWYNFDSWREFSYLDEEEKEKGENRDERRWIEKQNKVARQKKKKEEMLRLRQLVDNAYACDPRIQRFKEEERRRKLALKEAKQEAARAKALEEENRKEEELEMKRKAKEKELAEAKAQAESEKKAKKMVKQALKREQNKLRAVCKDHNYFMEDESECLQGMTETERLCERLSLERLEIINKDFSSLNGDREKLKQRFLKEVKDLDEKLEKEKEEMISLSQKSSTSNSAVINHKNWNHDDMALLVKAVNLFPAGTNQRWEVVASYINQHSITPNSKRYAKEVLAKAKDLQKLDPSMKEEVNKKAYQKFEQTQKPGGANDESVPTERFESPAEMLGINSWTAEEQRSLEQALKTYPANTPERWDRIAECIPNRSKKDCMKRYKDLVEMVKAKKAVQQNEKTRPS